MDPKSAPQYQQGLWSSRHSGDTRGIDWLKQDSIESLKQASVSFQLTSPTQRRMEPIRLSVPAKPTGPVTHRGRVGKMTDSQHYSNLQGLGVPLSTKNQLRQAMSVHKVDRIGAAPSSEERFKPNRTDSQFNITDQFSEEMVGRACLQPHPGQEPSSRGRLNLFTQGSPLGQVQRQKHYLN